MTRVGDRFITWWSAGIVGAALVLTFRLTAPVPSLSPWLESGFAGFAIAIVTYMVLRAETRITDAIATGGLGGGDLLAIRGFLAALEKEADRLNAPILRKLAGDFLQAGERGMRGLATFDQFDNSDEFLVQAMTRIVDFGPGDRIEAICGQKIWDDPAAEAYLQANLDAAEAGAHVERIFLQPDSGDLPAGERAWIRRHCDLAAQQQERNGTTPTCFPMVLNGKESERVRNEHGLPRGFGMTLIHRKSPARWHVLLHWGLGGGRSAAKVIDSRELYAVLRARYGVIRLHAPRDQRPPDGIDA